MLVLSILTIILVAVFIIIQLWAAIVYKFKITDSEFYFNNWRIYNKTDNGLLFRKKSKKELFLMPIVTFMYSRVERKAIIKRATKNAVQEKYNNRYLKKSARKLYDQAYLAKRKQMIVKAAQMDAETGGSRSSIFTVPFEKNLYQKVYTDNVILEGDQSSNVQQIYEALHGSVDFNSISDEDFEKVMKKSSR